MNGGNLAPLGGRLLSAASVRRLRRAMRTWARPEFLASLRDAYPEAFARRDTWFLLLYLALAWQTDRDGHVELPFETLAAVSGKLSARVVARQTFPEGRDTIRRLQRIIGADEAGRLRFEVRGHRAGVRPRTVVRLAFPDPVQRAVDAERLAGPARAGDRVCILTGTPIRSPRYDAAVRAAYTDAATHALAEEPPRGRAADLAAVLNGTPSNALARTVSANFPSAVRFLERRLERETALANGAGSERRARRARLRYDHDARTLGLVLAVPAPRYVAVPNSPRLFPYRGHLGALTSGTRRVLLRGLVELDLQAAQLATLCVVLDLPTVAAMLESGASPWTSVASAMGLDTTAATWPDVKGAIKNQGVYPGAYGRPVPWLKTKLDWAVGDALGVDGRERRFGEAFVSVEWVAELLDARDAALAEIDRRGGIHIHDGSFVALPGRAGDHVLAEGATAKTALVYAAAALELDVIGAAVDLQALEGARRFRVELLQHDGFSVRVVDRRRRAKVVRDLTSAVEARAARLGVPTRLVAVAETL